MDDFSEEISNIQDRKSYYSHDDDAWFLLDSNKNYHKFTNIAASEDEKYIFIPDIVNIDTVSIPTLATFMLLQHYVSEEGCSLWNFTKDRAACEIKDIIEAVFEPDNEVDYEELCELMYTYENKVVIE